MYRSKSLIQKFNHRYIPVPESGCWLWIGACNGDGYGKLYLNMDLNGRCKTLAAHRFSYQQFIGDIPAGKQLDHICRVRCCVNPYHLRAVTLQENMFASGSQSLPNLHKMTTHCPLGHIYNEINTIVRKSGRRNCRICHNTNSRNRRHIAKRLKQLGKK